MVDFANKCVNETIQLIKDGKQFAILMPVSLTSEIARLENVDGQRVHDIEIAKTVASMSKIVLASSAETWLISCPARTGIQPFLQQRHGRTWHEQSAGDLLQFISRDAS
jgi:hypothetical protein